MTSIQSQRAVRESPFRETEWDRRLDDMLEDLENSAAAGGGNLSQSSASHLAASQSHHHHQHHHQVQQHQRATAAAVVSHQKHQGNTSNEVVLSQHNGYGSVLQKSKSGNSLHENADSMLKEMDNALKASSNFIESHKSSSSMGPNSRSTQEFHEYRSYSSNGGGGHDGGDFNLERQVQHMMPPPSPSLSGLMQRSNQGRFTSSSQQSHSSNMTSYQQSQQQSFTTYKVQSNQYSSSGDRMISSNQGNPNDINGNERPGSRLKQNIDDLDTLLSDLNNAKSQPGPDYTASSDDYSFSEGHQGHVKHTVKSFNDYNYQSSSAKPPSPLPRRGSDSRPGRSLSSPSTVRKASPSPVSSTPRRPGGREPSPPNMSYSSAYHQSEHQSKTTTSSLHDYHRSSSPFNPDRGSPTPKGPGLAHDPNTPQGVSYYNKYHSSYSQHSQQPDGPPVPFPTNGTGPRRVTQTPPKRVDDLMTELSEFDPSIQPTGFVEPSGAPPSKNVELHLMNNQTTTETDYNSRRNYRDHSPSPVRSRSSPPRQQSTPGPAVYYPPGEMFSSTKTRHDSLRRSGSPAKEPSPQVSHSVSVEHSGERGRAKAKGKAEYGYKEKGRYSESDGKQGAAVVPICLPLCCAAPCVIL